MQKFTDFEIKCFDWLEKLRQSGIVNMYGARPYLAEAFELNKEESRNILIKWMENYEELMKLRGWER